MKKFSVLVTTYNSEKYLDRCISSIIEQTYKNMEIVIIDDGSTDNSYKVIEKLKSANPDIIKYYKQENKGVANARNEAVKKCEGEYFLFVDSDDCIDKELLKTLDDILKKEKEIDIIKYKMKIIGKNTSEIDGPTFECTSGEEAFNKLCFSDKIIDTPCIYLFNREFFMKNKFLFLENTYHEDFGLIPLIIVKAKTAKSIGFYGYNYIQEENSITRNSSYEKKVKQANDLLLHYDNMLIETEEIDDTTKKNIRQYYSNAIIKKANTLRKKEKKEYIKEIEKRNLIKNINAKNIKQKIKKIYLKIKLGLV